MRHHTTRRKEQATVPDIGLAPASNITGTTIERVPDIIERVKKAEQLARLFDLHRDAILEYDGVPPTDITGVTESLRTRVNDVLEGIGGVATEFMLPEPATERQQIAV